MTEEAMQWENEKEKKEALDSWVELTEAELEFTESIYKILESSTAKEEFIRLAKRNFENTKILGLMIHFNPF